MSTSIVTQWSYKDTDYADVDKLVKEAKISEAVAEVCVSRGIKTAQQLKDFTTLDLSALHDPWLLDDMEQAVDRLEKAILNKESVTLWGDYDVDGVTSTSIVKIAFDMLGGILDYHVPHRMIDGYDVKPKAVDLAVAAGSKVLMSVDCGIRAYKTAEYAKEKGIDFIVTDHHHPADDGRIPDCLAVVNPDRKDSTYPFRGLVGAGVALKVMMALFERMGRDPMEIFHECVDLAALGTVADVGVMTDENRIITHHGCKALDTTTKPGLAELLKLAGASKITTETIGFQIGPRINAVGRVGDSREALDCVLETHVREAQRRARDLDTINRQRQKKLETHMAEAYAMAETLESGPTIMVLYQPTWHIGLVGLVAGRLAEAYAVPVLAIGELGDGVTAKGSCRSTRDYDILSALTSKDIYPLFSSCGGHKFAAGFSLPIDNVPLLTERLHEYGKATLGPPSKSWLIDAIVSHQDIHLATYEQMQTLAPFGNTHSEPLFATFDMIIREVKTMSDGKHLKLKLSGSDGRGFYEAVMWSKGKLAEEFKEGDHVDVAYKMSKNSFGGRDSVQMLMEDLKHSS